MLKYTPSKSGLFLAAAFKMPALPSRLLAALPVPVISCHTEYKLLGRNLEVTGLEIAGAVAQNRIMRKGTANHGGHLASTSPILSVDK